MLGTRPDLAYTISALSKFSASAGTDHLTLAKRVLRYLKQTADIGITYKTDSPSEIGLLYGFSDSDWAGDLGDRKSTGGFTFLMSSAAISWKSKKQTIVALSTTEAEYIAASEAAREAIWLQRLLDDLLIITTLSPRSSPTIIFADSTGCLSQMENARHQERTKHIDIKYHYVRDVYEQNIINFQHCSTHDLTADILTKPLSRQLHWFHMGRIGLQ
jgi:hypothetical protein